MFYKDWKPIYNKILTDFNIDIKDDIKSAENLNILLNKKKNTINKNEIEKTIKNQEIIIFGAGPTLKETIQKNKEKIKTKIKITADGATTALLEKNIYPDIIVTDLDGKISDQIKANKSSSIAIIHAHGNNQYQIKKYIPKFKGKIIGTTQTDPSIFNMLENYGGFTDGDRAVSIATHFNAKNIKLIGFDYGKEIGEYSYSKKKDKNKKIKKLKWCKYIIEELRKKNKIQYI
jgi:uncharacterized Rossmann fold enzyme